MTPKSFLEQEIPAQGAALRRSGAAFPSAIAQLVETAATLGVDDWSVTGCGDSRIAGLCAEVWFARLAGRRLRTLHAMELSRYLYPAMSSRSLVVAVSHSGTTARVVEAARAARSRGAYVVALTANPASELAGMGDQWVDNGVRDERSNCRTASFQAVALFLRMLAERLGTAEAAVDTSGRLASAVDGHVAAARADVEALSLAAYSEHWIFTGSGLGHAVAEYGMAKLYESATVAAHAVELEQMIHCEIFTVGSGTVVVVVCPRGPGLSRAVELVEGLRRLGATTLAVTDDDELAAISTCVLRLPRGMAEDDLPFLGVLPLQWLALRLALLRGENPDLVANKWVNRPLIDS